VWWVVCYLSCIFNFFWFDVGFFWVFFFLCFFVFLIFSCWFLCNFLFGG